MTGDMGRPREFDMDQALKGAMGIFWRQGYLATNLPDLLTAMGLTRGSFYKAFTDKESVYLKSLDLYDREVVSATLEALSTCRNETAAQCLSLLFVPSQQPEIGCFICNAMVEMAPINPVVEERANQMAARLRDGVHQVLARFNVPAEPDARREMADTIVHLYFGFKALGRAAGPLHDWQARLEMLLRESVGD